MSHDLGCRAAAVHIQDVGPDLLRHFRTHRHSFGLSTENLHSERALILVESHLSLGLRIMAGQALDRNEF